jgi:hypothetical protein
MIYYGKDVTDKLPVKDLIGKQGLTTSLKDIYELFHKANNSEEEGSDKTDTTDLKNTTSSSENAEPNNGTEDVSTNTEDVSNNTEDVSANAEDVSTNTKDVSTNSTSESNTTESANKKSDTYKISHTKIRTDDPVAATDIIKALEDMDNIGPEQASVLGKDDIQDDDTEGKDEHDEGEDNKSDHKKLNRTSNETSESASSGTNNITDQTGKKLKEGVNDPLQN